MPDFAVVLRSCPSAARDQVAAYLGRAFSLKDATCASIAQSAPVVLLHGLNNDEVAACHVILSGLARMGAHTEFLDRLPPDLPKIDWPRRPQVFKRDLSDHIADLHFAVAGPSGQTTLLALVSASLGNHAPPMAPVAPAANQTPAPQEFRGIQLPEITPFATPVLPPGNPTPSGVASIPESGEAMSRLNELFPDEGGFVPNNQDITSILNRLLPDEHPQGQPAAGPGELSKASSNRAVSLNGAPAPAGPAGFAVFLAKIADEGRRQKAVPLIAELSKISAEEAEILSKKVIIPVMKGASKDDAEAARQKFAKIGIIARVKAPE
jgi:hypothetical protein